MTCEGGINVTLYKEVTSVIQRWCVKAKLFSFTTKL